MPEEVNRVLTDHVSDLLFVTEQSGIENLRHEGIASEKVHLVGNTMIDSLLQFKDAADGAAMLRQLEITAGAYALLTLHRPSNVDERDALVNILDGLEELAESCPIVFPVHPRTQRRLDEFGVKARHSFRAGRIVLAEPLGYLDFVGLMRHARLVATDSGGIQEETTCLGVPCVTVRNNTERPVTVTDGTNVIAGTDKMMIADAVRRQLSQPKRGATPPLWDGRAGDRIIDRVARSVALPATAVVAGVS
jgi:UDP-N-acetylglucosamine 2-epimerase (non-hydrolysing)